MLALLSDKGVGRGGHADKVAEHIDAVVDQKTLDYKVCFALTCRAQIGCALCHPIGAVTTFFDHILRCYPLPSAKLPQYIESLSYLAQ